MGMPIQFLNGIDTDTLNELEDLAGFGSFAGLGDSPSDADAMQAVYNHLVKTRDMMIKSPGIFQAQGDVSAMVQLYTHAINAWNTPNREAAINLVSDAEEKLIDSGKLNGIDDDYNDLGRLFKKKKKAPAKAVVQAAKAKINTQNAAHVAAKKTYSTTPVVSTLIAQNKQQVATSPVVPVVKQNSSVVQPLNPTSATVQPTTAIAVQSTASAPSPKKKKKGFFAKVGTAIKSGAKAVVKAVVRFNPVTILARNGMLIAMRMNIKGMATKLEPAYLTESEALSRGISKETYEGAKKQLKKVESMFSSTLRGKNGNLKSAIQKGGKLPPKELDSLKDKNATTAAVADIIDEGEGAGTAGLAGLGQLGIVAESAVAASTPFIIKAWNFIKEIPANTKAVATKAYSAVKEKVVNTFTAKANDAITKVSNGENPFKSSSSSQSSSSASTNDVETQTPSFQTQSEAGKASGNNTTNNEKMDNPKQNVFTKAIDFVKQNPLVAVGALAVASLAFRPVREFVGLQKPSTSRAALPASAVSGLSGVRRKKRKTTKVATTTKRKVRKPAKKTTARKAVAKRVSKRVSTLKLK